MTALSTSERTANASQAQKLDGPIAFARADFMCFVELASACCILARS
jgi:hypothetical protein